MTLSKKQRPLSSLRSRLRAMKSRGLSTPSSTRSSACSDSDRLSRLVPAELQIYDRSPVCTLALSVYLGLQAQKALSEEIERIRREDVYERRVFFVRDIGFIEPTDARRITFEQSVEFERIHVQTYLRLGYELVDVPRADVAD